MIRRTGECRLTGGFKEYQIKKGIVMPILETGRGGGILTEAEWCQGEGILTDVEWCWGGYMSAEAEWC